VSLSRTIRGMDDLGYAAFDADNHYYEAIDAFTRHLDPKLGPRCVQWAEIEGRRYHVVGGRVSRAVVNPTFDPIAKAGALHDYFRGNPDGKSPLEFLRAREPIRPEYRDRDARLAVLDEFGLDGVWMFPTLGVLYEELLKHDPEAVGLTFTAFNRWLDEDWGLNYRDRIYAAPYLSLCDVDWAIRELEWALDRDVRVVVMRPAAPTTAIGQRSPSDVMFDPFWARVNEAGVTVVVHAGDSGYSSQGYARDGFAATFGGEGAGRPSIKLLAIERAAYDFLLAITFDGLFDRFPNLRVASVENGSEFLPDLLKKLASTHRKMPGVFPADPVETFRRNVWINPFWEDDPYEIVELMGDDRVIFGSDWPHIEGMPRPLDYVTELKELDDEPRRRVLRENALELTARRPT
jgi:predicted TIM-barrel fold metal-dependent hydrolase